MKINGSSDASAPQPSTSQAAGKAVSAQSSATGAANPVSLSDLSASLHALEASGPGDFDAAKVENIKQAIRDGKFEVNSSAVADKLISSVHELFGATH
jgi:negative regulator of flagellin synthesis FlgM